MLLIHRLFIKTSLVYLFLGAVAGGWMLLAQTGVLASPAINLISIHAHLVGIGFFLQMVCGVALWMFPRKTGESRERAARDPLAWATYFLITGGLAVRTLASLSATVVGNTLLASSTLLQLAGIMAFVVGIWPRVYLPGAKTMMQAASQK
ncbi:MAG: hypothetical protein HY649_07035 [Acidobacteria bacterium]|nr:hypothetical protein [Acidobacteriota bacterium]